MAEVPLVGGQRRTADRRVAAAARALHVLSRRAWFVEDEVAGVADHVPAGGTCVDIGAQYGLYTIAMAAAAGPAGTVHAVEPQETPNRVIGLVVGALGIRGRVVRHRCALGDRPGTSELSIPIRRGRAVHGRAFVVRGALHHGPNGREFGAERRRQVRVSTLDELAEEQQLRRLDLVKADVEGAELQVLLGGASTIDRFRPVVQLEIEAPHVGKYGHSVPDVTGFLCDRGYSMHVWRRSRWSPTTAVTSAARNYLFTPDRSLGSPTPRTESA